MIYQLLKTGVFNKRQLGKLNLPEINIGSGSLADSVKDWLYTLNSFEILTGSIPPGQTEPTGSETSFSEE